MTEHRKPTDSEIPPRDDEGVVDGASAAIEDIAEDFLNLDKDKDPTPGRLATSRG